MELVVPVVTLLRDNGGPDEEATRRYAAAFRSWSDHATALLCGSTGLGDTLTAAERRRVVDVWADVLPATRTVRCAWEVEEAAYLAGPEVRVLLAGSAVDGPARLAAAVARLGGEVLVYSHPRFGWAVTPDLVAGLRRRGAAPRGFKLSKTSPEAIGDCRAAAGRGAVLWDGSARRIATSLRAGADGVSAACLAALPARLSGAVWPPDPGTLQRLVDACLVPLDALPDRRARVGWLTDLVRARLRDEG